MLPLCKFYRYLIYRLYHFQSDTPITNVIVTLGVVHLFIVMALLIAFCKGTGFDLFPEVEGNELIIIICALLWFALHYFLLYNKDKWKSFDKEFKTETPKHKRIGFWVVIFYLLGCYIASFGVIIWVCS